MGTQCTWKCQTFTYKHKHKHTHVPVLTHVCVYMSQYTLTESQPHISSGSWSPAGSRGREHPPSSAGKVSKAQDTVPGSVSYLWAAWSQAGQCSRRQGRSAPGWNTPAASLPLLQQGTAGSGVSPCTESFKKRPKRASGSFPPRSPLTAWLLRF